MGIIKTTKGGRNTEHKYKDKSNENRRELQIWKVFIQLFQ